MKVVILAAGKGTRMLPLTEHVPKVLVPINGKPFLYYLMKRLQKAGFADFCLIVGYKKEKIAEFLDEHGFRAKIVEQKKQLGTGDAVMQAREFAGESDFIVLGGDNLWSVEDLRKIKKEDNLNYVCGFKVKDWHKYGILVHDKTGFLKEIREKPKEFVGNLINTGLFKFKPEIFEALDKIRLSPRGELELTDAVSLLAGKKKVKIIKAKEWIDLGCLEDIPIVEKYLSSKNI